MTISIKDIPFFQDLTPDELGTVKQCLREKTFEKGETLFLEGSACERVFFVRSGRVKVARTASSGREQILETLGPGDTCACNPGTGGWACASNAEAVTPCTVWYLSRDHYMRFVRDNSKLSHALNRLFAERLQCLSALIEEVSLKDSKKRLIKFLLDLLKEERPEKGKLKIPFTREELAQRLGVARETVARQLYALKRKKLIDIQPHEIHILNDEGLRKLL